MWSWKNLSAPPGLGVKRSYRKAADHANLLHARLRSLLKLWEPQTVITLVSQRRSKEIQELFRRIRKEVSPKSFVAVRDSRYRGGRDKHERAIAVATRFPEITWKLPAKRLPGKVKITRRAFSTRWTLQQPTFPQIMPMLLRRLG